MSGGRRSTLAHPLYGEILRSGLASTTRRRLLLERVRAIEDRGSRRREDVVTIASTYLDATGTADPELLTAAARFARHHHDHAQVVRLARAATTRHVRPESGLLLGEALHDLARYEEAGDVLASALEAVDGDDSLFAPIVEMQVRNLMWGLHRGDDALALLRMMRDRTQDVTVRAEFVAEEAMALAYSGKPLAALGVLEHLDDAAPPRAKVIAAIAAEPALLMTGRCEEADALSQRALEEHRRLNQHVAMAEPGVHLSFRVQALTNKGRLDESNALARRCYERIPLDAPPNNALWFVMALGRNALLAGQLDTARRWFAEAVTRCEHSDDGPRRVALSFLATAAAWAADIDGATVAVEELQELEAFAFLPGEQYLGPAWATAATGAHSTASEMLVSGAQTIVDAGHRFMAAWLLHDACRLGHAGTLGTAPGPGGTVRGRPRARMDCARSRRTDRRRRSPRGRGRQLRSHWRAALRSRSIHRRSSRVRPRWRPARRRRTSRGAAALQRRCESVRTPALVTAGSIVPLTAREREICTLAAHGASGPEIAAKLFLSVRTVNNHLQRAYAKLGVTNRNDLAAALHVGNP